MADAGVGRAHGADTSTIVFCEIASMVFAVFASGEARWIGITLQGPGESEGLRMRLTSVPYAVHASNAETLGGRPARRTFWRRVLCARQGSLAAPL